MRAYLVNTNVISITVPANSDRNHAVLNWLEVHTNSLFLAVASTAEIESGIANAERKEQRRKVVSLTAWLEATLHLYSHRVLPFDITIARAAGRLNGFARGAGISPGFADIAIAATAVTYDLMILTATFGTSSR